jgi:hypothetical protein
MASNIQGKTRRLCSGTADRYEFSFFFIRKYSITMICNAMQKSYNAGATGAFTATIINVNTLLQQRVQNCLFGANVYRCFGFSQNNRQRLVS